MSSRINEDLLTLIANSSARGFNNKVINQGGTLSILTSTSGVLHSTAIGQNSCPSLTLYDNASGASGTILLQVSPGNQSCYVQDLTYVNGVTALVAAGNAFIVNVGLR